MIFMTARCALAIYIIYIAAHCYNLLADAISRNDAPYFLSSYSQANPCPTPIPPEMIPYPPTVPLLEGQSRFLVQNLPLSHFFITVSRFFYCFLGTNLSLDLIIFSYFCQICKNVPLLDQKSCFFRSFVLLFASGRLVGM